MTLETTPCSFCIGGTTFSPHTGLFHPCRRCGGVGLIVTNHICACGAPVTVKSDDDLLYCGDKGCLVDLRSDAAEDKRFRETGYTSPATQLWQYGSYSQ